MMKIYLDTTYLEKIDSRALLEVFLYVKDNLIVKIREDLIFMR